MISSQITSYSEWPTRIPPVSREFLEDLVKRHSYRIDADGTHYPLSEKALNNCVKGLECLEGGCPPGLPRSQY